ncbi:MAG: hypothetical protein KAJ14_02065, partial [Candidatus Omnitrophica bacterium]|nr:hypothetical protein [Candidatus Omnitrophota bacterium]
ESIQHNYSFPYEVPEFGFETKEKYRTKEWMAVNYGSKEIVHLVKEKEGTAPENEYTHRYEYDQYGNQKDKNRVDILLVWGKQLFSGLLIWLCIPTVVFFLVMVAGRIAFIFGERKRKEERGLPQENLETSISDREIQENIGQVRKLLKNLPEYGFEDGVVEEVKTYFEENIIQKLEKRQLSEVIEEVFDGYGYKDFVENVLEEKLDVSALTLKDVYLWQCIHRSAMNFSSETPDFVSYLFWKSLGQRSRGEPIGSFVKERVTLWFKIMELQIGAFKKVIPAEYYLIYNDVNELFRIKSFVKEFEEKVLRGEYGGFILTLEKKVKPLVAKEEEYRKKFGEKNIVKTTRAVLQTEEFKEYKRFIFAVWKKESGIRSILKMKLIRFLRSIKGTYYEISPWSEDSLCWKTFADKNGGRWGWKGWASLLRNGYKVMAIFWVMLYAESYFGLVPSIGVSGWLIMGVFLAISLVTMKKGLDSWLEIKNHPSPARLDEGVHPEKVTTQKILRWLFWASVFVPKLLWNYYVFTHLGIVTHELWPVALFSGEAFLNVFTIGIVWFPFVIFFFLDRFSFFYIVESIVSYIYKKYMGVGTIKFWHELDENFETISKRFTEKFIPGDLVLTEEEKTLVWARAWNLIVNTLYEQDRVTEEEMKRYIYGLQEDPHDFYGAAIYKKPDLSLAPCVEKTEQRLVWFCSQSYMSKPVVPMWQNLFSLTVLTPVGNEEIIYSFEDINKPDEKMGLSDLNKVVCVCPQEWENFIQRMGKKEYPEQDIEKMRSLSLGKPLETKNEALQFEVRLWVSYRFQPLARTVRGIMYYKDILTLLIRIQFPKLSEDQIRGEVHKKFNYTIALDKYYRWKKHKTDESLRTKGNDIEHLMKMYPGLLHIVHISKDDKGWYTSLAKGEVDTISGKTIINQGLDNGKKIRLAGMPILGEGKPEGLNNGLKFVRREKIMSIDINQ